MDAAQMHSEASTATQRPCEGCGGGFLAKRRWQRFCGTACRNDWHRRNSMPAGDRLEDVERRVKELERRVTVLDDPLRR